MLFPLLCIFVDHLTAVSQDTIPRIMSRLYEYSGVGAGNISRQDANAIHVTLFEEYYNDLSAIVWNKIPFSTV